MDLAELLYWDTDVDDITNPDPFGPLLRSVAEFRLLPTPAAHAAIVASAVDLLAAGIDSPNLRILAGEDRADSEELTRYLDATLVDMGMIPLDDRTAVLLLMKATAADLVAGRVHAIEAARRLWDLWYPKGDELAVGRDAMLLAYEADAFLEGALEGQEPTADDLATAARVFVAGRHAG